MLLLFLPFHKASGIGCSDPQLYLLWTVLYVCGLLDNDLYLQGNARLPWAGSAQLEKAANEAEVEGFGPCEPLASLWSLVAADTPNPHSSSRVWASENSRVQKDRAFQMLTCSGKSRVTNSDDGDWR